MAAGEVSSADGEDGDDSDNGVVFHVEAKSFSWHPLEDLVLLRESHKRWKREIRLSTEQLSWISEELRERNVSFGFANRKVSKSFKDGVVLLIEGKNQWGVFISVEVKRDSQNSEYVIIPAGADGRHWGRFARWIKDASLLERNYNTTQHSVRASCQMDQSSSHQPRSYADAVRSVSSDGYCSLERQVLILGQKLDSVLGELFRLQSSICSFSSGELGVAPLLIQEMAKSDSTQSLPGCDGDLLFWKFSDEGSVGWKGFSITWEEMCGGDMGYKSPKGSVVPWRRNVANSEVAADQVALIDDAKGVSDGTVDNLESPAFHRDDENEACGFVFQTSASIVETSVSEIVDGYKEQTEFLKGIENSTDSNTVACNEGSSDDEVLSISKEESTGSRFGEDEGPDIFEIQNSKQCVNGKVGSRNEDDSGVANCQNLVFSDVRDHHVDTSWGSDKIFDVGPVGTFDLKAMLKEAASRVDYDSLPKGKSILIEGEYFDGAIIFESLIPPERARVSKIAFKLWRRNVGRPLLKKLRECGLDVGLNLYEKALT